MRRKLASLVLLTSCLGLISMAPALAQENAGKQPPIDLNTASVDELTSLPGVGQKVAERIVAYREANGPFEKKEELMNVRGIGEKTFLKLERLIKVEAQTSKKK
ncbi:MAG TPA: helix-hairpin-helix domain-containing protein [Vicinamibacteria bacterium]|nr:helix-hairpin-helix domain-containing protein [Vicinamibacteria bacterium]